MRCSLDWSDSVHLALPGFLPGPHTAWWLSCLPSTTNVQLDMPLPGREYMSDNAYGVARFQRARLCKLHCTRTASQGRVSAQASGLQHASVNCCAGQLGCSTGTAAGLCKAALLLVATLSASTGAALQCSAAQELASCSPHSCAGAVWAQCHVHRRRKGEAEHCLGSTTRVAPALPSGSRRFRASQRASWALVNSRPWTRLRCIPHQEPSITGLFICAVLLTQWSPHMQASHQVACKLPIERHASFPSSGMQASLRGRASLPTGANTTQLHDRQRRAFQCNVVVFLVTAQTGVLSPHQVNDQL